MLFLSVADMHHFDADRDLACHFFAGPDPACHFDPDPDPTFYVVVDPDTAFHFGPDPDPQHCSSWAPKIRILKDSLGH